MKKIIRITLLSVVSLLIFCSLCGCNLIMSQSEASKKDYKLKLLTEYNGNEVDLACKNVRNYIRSKNQTDRLATMLIEQLNKNTNDRIYEDKQNISFSWEPTLVDETFTIHFSYTEDFKEELFTYQTQSNRVDELGVFIPGKTYYYKVVGSVTGESKVDSFKTKNLPVRFITCGNILNMRDIGGWETTNGATVKYGMLYRGAALDGSEKPSGEQYILERGTSRLDDYGLIVFNDYLKIKGEIDLRGVAGDQHDSPTFGGESKYLCQVADVSLTALWNKIEDQTLKNALKTYFSFLKDENNYPIYFHCNGGADRTGALAFLINGLLGVSYADLAIDYELTSFSFAAGGIRKRSDIISSNDGSATFDEPNDGDPTVGYCRDILLKNYGDGKGDLQYAIENYLISSCGISSLDIEKIKQIMLEK